MLCFVRRYTFRAHTRRELALEDQVALDSSADGAVHMEARLTDPDNTDRQLAMDLVFVGLDPSQVFWADVSFAAPELLSLPRQHCHVAGNGG